MPNYKANILLHQAEEADYVLLEKRLHKKSYQHLETSSNLTGKSELHFKIWNSPFEKVLADILCIAKKSGKPYSFTIQTEN